ncbi:XRE family transcriptional regulator [Basfia succiniciproducens]|uniref:XRE family transcriptional regulator n=1 Tax=Basfia succiniciproducens TaxID=653940 RepID=UPI003FCC45A2
MSDLATRLKHLLYEKHLSMNAFAKQIGLSQPAIAKIVSGETRSPKNILEIAAALDVNPHWLKTGEGDKFGGQIEAMRTTPDDEHIFRIDLLDVSASAGDGVSNTEYPDVIHSIYFSLQGLRDVVGVSSGSGIYLINVPSDSMAPTIKKGDVVFVDTKINRYVDEGIYVFDLDGDTYIKRLQKMPKGIYRALSDNKNYDPFDITEQEFSTAVIRGKFIRVLPINPVDL